MNKEIVNQAAEWFVELNEGEADKSARQQFDAWLRQSPEHVRAYLRMLPIWEEGSRLDAQASDDPEAIIAWARAGDNVVPLDAGREESPANLSSTSNPVSWRRKLSLAIAASVAVAILGTWLYSQLNTYSTGIGEQRLIALADGSKVELNSRSRIHVRFSGDGRDVDLLEGQALFRVAHDKTRPFIVHSADTKIRAVGTQFDVYRKPSGTVVTVLEGRVAVRNSLLTAGEQITVSSDTPHVAPEPKRTDVAAATAWTQQHLVFSKTPLTAVAEEFNRYNTRQLVIKDDGLETFNVSGTFSSTDPTSLVRFLRAQPGIQVTETRSEIHIAEKGSQ